ncbi:hypothetical protein RD792_002196 [Penstemon davidsonii]|uniref:Uncharacterized protein n=1 Tax=Penstemon davidsonii TaxID=160366 RepID=A0ABR0DQF0_9LAMI|nr:hypothetical protein RD792_002196 [Penstemon davidsonii]
MGRSPCCEKAHTNKGAWTKEEDDRLIAYIRAHGEGCWRSLPKAAGLLRCGKSCRLRWINYLRPDLKRGNFTQQEDELIIKLHSLLGNKWSLIAGRLPGRTDNEIKNYWNTHIRRKLVSRGIDPTSHKPINNIIQPQEQEQEEEEEEEKKIKTSVLNKQEEEVLEEEERCPDLNLDLRISPPPHQEPFKTGASTLCFVCSTLGGKACNCNEQAAGAGSIIISGSGSRTNSGYDFLALDYRSLQMK